MVSHPRRRGRKGKKKRPKKRLTASDAYQLIVGEIGLPRRDFLYEIRFWEVQPLINGYSLRRAQMWSAARWHAFNVMAAIPYCDLKKNGIYKPQDLIQFPWDSQSTDVPTDEEAEEMIKMMNEMNEERPGSRE